MEAEVSWGFSLGEKWFLTSPSFYRPHGSGSQPFLHPQSQDCTSADISWKTHQGGLLVPSRCHVAGSGAPPHTLVLKHLFSPSRQTVSSRFNFQWFPDPILTS